MGDPIDTDKLPVQQYLVLEVLAARYRTGETVWTFPSRVRWALLHLAELGLIGYKSGIVARTWTAAPRTCQPRLERCRPRPPHKPRY